MYRPIATAAAALLAAACAAEDAAQTRPPAEEAVEQRTADIEGREFAEVTVDEMRPAFTKERVIKLNAIVSRSLAVANAYAAAAKDLRAAVDAATEPDAAPDAKATAEMMIGALDDWRTEAAAARTEMDAEVADLKASGERYNAEILAGMIKYVTDVHAAVDGEYNALARRIGGDDQTSQ